MRWHFPSWSWKRESFFYALNTGESLIPAEACFKKRVRTYLGQMAHCPCMAIRCAYLLFRKPQVKLQLEVWNHPGVTWNSPYIISAVYQRYTITYLSFILRWYWKCSYREYQPCGSDMQFLDIAPSQGGVRLGCSWMFCSAGVFFFLLQLIALKSCWRCQQQCILLPV